MNEKVGSFLDIRRANQIQAGASIQQSIEGRRKIFVAKVLDLSTARDQFNPEIVDFNFRTFWVMSATDSSVQVSMIPNNRTEGQLNGPITCTQNLSIKLPEPTSGAQLFWSAQSGKTATILFFVDGDITPGSLISQITGGVNLSDGTGRNDSALGAGGASSSVSVGAVATLVMAQLSTRVSAELEVTGGTVKIGGSTVSAAKGVTRNDGDRWEDRNTGALYAITVSGAPVITGIVYT